MAAAGKHAASTPSPLRGECRLCHGHDGMPEGPACAECLHWDSLAASWIPSLCSPAASTGCVSWRLAKIESDQAQILPARSIDTYGRVPGRCALSVRARIRAENQRIRSCGPSQNSACSSMIRPIRHRQHMVLRGRWLCHHL